MLRQAAQMGKILYLVNVDWFFISHRLPIAKAALEAGYEVHVATGVTSKKTELESYGFIVHSLPIRRGKTSLISELATYKNIVSIFRQIKPDLIHLITIKPVLFGGLATYFCKVRGVVSAISGLGYVFTAEGRTAKARRWLVGCVYFLAMRHKNLKVIFQNKDDQQVLCKAASLSTSSTVMIPGSGVDLNQFRYIAESERALVVVMASRLLLDKGVVEFVDAAVRLSERFKQVTFKLVGSIDSDNPASVTEKQIVSWKSKGVVQVLGQHDNIAQLLSDAHIVVLPSYREGFPKGLIEAAACGRAVVTTDVPGCRDAIIPDETGLLVPVRDSKALADAIQVLLENSEMRKKMGIAGRKLAEERYSIDKVVATHLSIYQELLAKV